MSATSSNLSFVLEKPFSVKYEERPMPEITSPKDVIVRVVFTGICGSDVHYWTDGAIGKYVLKKPMVLGHESSGIIHAVGSEVHNLKVGDKVTMEPGIPCRYCEQCKSGHYNLCPEMAFAATPPIDGTLTKFYRLPSDFCVKLPQNISLEEGAVVEPAAVGVHMNRLAQIKPGDRLVVLGAGPVGLLCGKIARHVFGATQVVSVDINENRLNFAKEHGATDIYLNKRNLSSSENAERLKEMCGLSEGCDAVIEASGSEVCSQMAVHVVRNGGRYVQGGMGKTDINFPIGILCGKELYVTGSFRYAAGDYNLAVQMIANGKLVVKDLITNVVTFKEAEKAFQNVHEGKGIKWLIEGPE